MSHPGYIPDPFDTAAFARVAPENAVLLVGTGLTAADVVAILARQGHRGHITAISRRGLLPQPQGDPPDVAALMQRFARPVPRFIERHGGTMSLRAVLRALRRDMSRASAEGIDQKSLFDEVRDASGWLWRDFTDREKRRFLGHLKPFYDVNRYRMVPQTGATVATMIARGQLEFHAARLTALDKREDRLEAMITRRDGTKSRMQFDNVINCTGPRTDLDEPFLNSLRKLGLARADSLGLGLDVDQAGRLVGKDGTSQSSIWAFGPLTRARFGDITAIPQIAFQIHRNLPALSQSIVGAEISSCSEAPCETS